MDSANTSISSLHSQASTRITTYFMSTLTLHLSKYDENTNDPKLQSLKVQL